MKLPLRIFYQNLMYKAHIYTHVAVAIIVIECARIKYQRWSVMVIPDVPM